jgi:hypothetical protein
MFIFPTTRIKFHAKLSISCAIKSKTEYKFVELQRYINKPRLAQANMPYRTILKERIPSISIVMIQHGVFLLTAFNDF